MLTYQSGKKRIFIKVISLAMAQVFFITSIGYPETNSRSIFKNKKPDYKAAQEQNLYLLEKKKNLSSGKPLAKKQNKIALYSIKDISSIYIPDSLGKVIEAYNSPDPKATIIHIQDLHTNPEAQLNLSKILELLIKDYNLNLVLSEGATGEVDTSSVSSFPDPEAREKTARLFINSGELTGEEYLSITKYPNLPIWGIEDKDLYFQNIIEFNKIMEFSPGSQVFINQVKEALDELKPKIYSQKLLELDNKELEYESGSLDTKEYLNYLLSIISSPLWGEGKGEGEERTIPNFKNITLFKETLNLENTINQDKITQESQELLTNLQNNLQDKKEIDTLLTKLALFKDQKISPYSFYSYLAELSRRHLKEIDLNKYPSLFTYIDYLAKLNSLDSNKLFSEIEELIYEIKDNNSSNDNQKLLTKSLRHIKYLESFFNLKVSNEELDYYLNNKEAFKVSSFESFLKPNIAKYSLNVFIDFNPDLIDKNLSELEHFYDLAYKRDTAMLNNSISELTKRSSKISALITGGFHTQGITKLLKSQGYSYIVISPYSKTEIDEENYHFLLSGKRKPIDEMINDLNEKLRVILAFSDKSFKEDFNNLVKRGVQEGWLDKEDIALIDTNELSDRFMAIETALGILARLERNLEIDENRLGQMFVKRFRDKIRENESIRIIKIGEEWYVAYGDTRLMVKGRKIEAIDKLPDGKVELAFNIQPGTQKLAKTENTIQLAQKETKKVTEPGAKPLASNITSPEVIPDVGIKKMDLEKIEPPVPTTLTSHTWGKRGLAIAAIVATIIFGFAPEVFSSTALKHNHAAINTWVNFLSATRDLAILTMIPLAFMLTGYFGGKLRRACDWIFGEPIDVKALNYALPIAIFFIPTAMFLIEGAYIDVGDEFKVILGMSLYYITKLFIDNREDKVGIRKSVFYRPAVASTLLSLATYYNSNVAHQILNHLKGTLPQLVRNQFNDVALIPLAVLLTPILLSPLFKVLKSKTRIKEIPSDTGSILKALTQGNNNGRKLLYLTTAFWVNSFSVVFEALGIHSTRSFGDVIAYILGGVITITYVLLAYPSARTIAPSQIGKLAEVESIQKDSQGKALSFKVKDMPQEIPLEPLEVNLDELEGKLLGQIDASYHPLIKDIISIIKSRAPPFYTYSTLVEDLFGFSRPQDNLIALHNFLKDNPIALFHEIGEYLINSGEINLGLETDNTLIIMQDSQGNETHRVKLTREDALSQIPKGPANPHYLLRALQREVFGDKDKDFTDEIKYRQRVSVPVDQTAGLCVTTDTLLPVLSAKIRNPKSEIRNKFQIRNSNDQNNNIELKPIIDVQHGDYVLSLNEETQQIEPHRINALLDMGIKPVYKLTTASGRSIKTTANHPYLVRIQDSLKDGFSHERRLKPTTPLRGGVAHFSARSEWVKISELKVKDEIGVPKSDSMESITALLDYRNTSKELFFSNPAEKIFDNSGNLANAQEIGPEKDNSAIGSSRITQDVSEIGIAGNKYKRFSFYEFVDFLIRGIGFNVTDIHDIMAGVFEDFSNRTGTVCVNENFHGLRGRLDNQFLFVSQKSGIQHTSIDIFCSNWAEFVFNLFKTHSGSQSFKYNMYRNASPFNAGFSMLDFRVYANIFVNRFFMEHFGFSFSVLLEAYHILENLSSKAYADMSGVAGFSLCHDERELKFATPYMNGVAKRMGRASRSDILWDRIISIEYIGEEHVYDIEVEGTHNFIGNGIFAHNTYVEGVTSEEQFKNIELSSISIRKSVNFLPFFYKRFSPKEKEIMKEEVRNLTQRLDLSLSDKEIDSILSKVKLNSVILIFFWQLIYGFFIISLVQLPDFSYNLSFIIEVSIFAVFGTIPIALTMANYLNPFTKTIFLNPREKDFAAILLNHELVHWLHRAKLICRGYPVAIAAEVIRGIEKFNQIKGYHINDKYFKKGIELIDNVFTKNDFHFKIEESKIWYLEDYDAENFIAGIAYQIYKKTGNIDLSWEFIREISKGKNAEDVVRRISKKKKGHGSISGVPPESHTTSVPVQDKNQSASSTSPKIGKLAEVDNVQKDSQGKALSFKVKDRPQEIPLTTLEVNLDELEGKLLGQIDISYHPLIKDIISIIKSRAPPFYSYSTLVEDLFGFSRSQNNLIALHNSLKDDPIALFHEIGEYLINSGNINLELGADNTLIIIKGSQGNDIHGLKLTREDALSQIPKGPTNPHYLLRALQREIFGDVDKDLTRKIKDRGIEPSTIPEAMGKGPALNEAGFVNVADLNGKEKRLVNEKIKELAQEVKHAIKDDSLNSLQQNMAWDIVERLSSLLIKEDGIGVFEGIVNSDSDYLLAFVRDGEIAISEDFFSEKFEANLGEILFRQGLSLLYPKALEGQILEKAIFGDSAFITSILPRYVAASSPSIVSRINNIVRLGHNAPSSRRIISQERLFTPVLEVGEDTREFNPESLIGGFVYDTSTNKTLEITNVLRSASASIFETIIETEGGLDINFTPLKVIDQFEDNMVPLTGFTAGMEEENIASVERFVFLRDSARGLTFENINFEQEIMKQLTLLAFCEQKLNGLEKARDKELVDKRGALKKQVMAIQESIDNLKIAYLFQQEGVDNISFDPLAFNFEYTRVNGTKISETVAKVEAISVTIGDNGSLNISAYGYGAVEKTPVQFALNRANFTNMVYPIDLQWMPSGYRNAINPIRSYQAMKEECDLLETFYIEDLKAQENPAQKKEIIGKILGLYRLRLRVMFLEMLQEGVFDIPGAVTLELASDSFIIGLKDGQRQEKSFYEIAQALIKKIESKSLSEKPRQLSLEFLAFLQEAFIEPKLQENKILEKQLEFFRNRNDAEQLQSIQAIANIAEITGDLGKVITEANNIYTELNQRIDILLYEEATGEKLTPEDLTGQKEKTFLDHLRKERYLKAAAILYSLHAFAFIAEEGMDQAVKRMSFDWELRKIFHNGSVDKMNDDVKHFLINVADKVHDGNGWVIEIKELLRGLWGKIKDKLGHKTEPLNPVSKKTINIQMEGSEGKDGIGEGKALGHGKGKVFGGYGKGEDLKDKTQVFRYKPASPNTYVKEGSVDTFDGRYWDNSGRSFNEPIEKGMPTGRMATFVQRAPNKEAGLFSIDGSFVDFSSIKVSDGANFTIDEANQKIIFESPYPNRSISYTVERYEAEQGAERNIDGVSQEFIGHYTQLPYDIDWPVFGGRDLGAYLDDIRSLPMPQRLQKIEDIVWMVKNNIKYPNIMDEDVAKQLAELNTSYGNRIVEGILQDRQTDCTGFNTVLIAMLRYIGIPARMAIGYLDDGDGIGVRGEGHGWSEIYYNASWHKYDATGQMEKPEEPAYEKMVSDSETAQNDSESLYKLITDTSNSISLMRDIINRYPIDKKMLTPEFNKYLELREKILKKFQDSDYVNIRDILDFLDGFDVSFDNRPYSAEVVDEAARQLAMDDKLQGKRLQDIRFNERFSETIFNLIKQDKIDVPGLGIRFSQLPSSDSDSIELINGLIGLMRSREGFSFWKSEDYHRFIVQLRENADRVVKLNESSNDAIDNMLENGFDWMGQEVRHPEWHDLSYEAEREMLDKQKQEIVADLEKILNVRGEKIDQEALDDEERIRALIDLCSLFNAHSVVSLLRKKIEILSRHDIDVSKLGPLSVELYLNLLYKIYAVSYIGTNLITEAIGYRYDWGFKDAKTTEALRSSLGLWKTHMEQLKYLRMHPEALADTETVEKFKETIRDEMRKLIEIYYSQRMHNYNSSSEMPSWEGIKTKTINTIESSFAHTLSAIDKSGLARHETILYLLERNLELLENMPSSDKAIPPDFTLDNNFFVRSASDITSLLENLETHQLQHEAATVIVYKALEVLESHKYSSQEVAYYATLVSKLMEYITDVSLRSRINKELKAVIENTSDQVVIFNAVNGLLGFNDVADFIWIARTLNAKFPDGMSSDLNMKLFSFAVRNSTKIKESDYDVLVKVFNAAKEKFITGESGLSGMETAEACIALLNPDILENLKFDYPQGIYALISKLAKLSLNNDEEQVVLSSLIDLYRQYYEKSMNLDLTIKRPGSIGPYDEIEKLSRVKQLLGLTDATDTGVAILSSLKEGWQKENEPLALSQNQKEALEKVTSDLAIKSDKYNDVRKKLLLLINAHYLAYDNANPELPDKLMLAKGLSAIDVLHLYDLLKEPALNKEELEKIKDTAQSSYEKIVEREKKKDITKQLTTSELKKLHFFHNFLKLSMALVDLSLEDLQDIGFGGKDYRDKPNLFNIGKWSEMHYGILSVDKSHLEFLFDQEMEQPSRFKGGTPIGKVYNEAGSSKDGAYTGGKVSPAQAKAAWNEALISGESLPQERIDKLMPVWKSFFGPDTPLPNVRILSHGKMQTLGLGDKGVVRYKGIDDSNNIIIDKDYLENMQNKTTAEIDLLVNILVHEGMAHYAEVKGIKAEDLSMFAEAKADLEDWQMRQKAHEGLIIDRSMEGISSPVDAKENKLLAFAREAVEHFSPSIPYQCANATGWIAAALNRAEIPNQKRFLHISRAGGSGHVVLEAFYEGRVWVIDTQLLHFTLPKDNKLPELSLPEGFVSQYVYSAEEYYANVPAFDGGILKQRITRANISYDNGASLEEGWADIPRLIHENGVIATQSLAGVEAEKIELPKISLEPKIPFEDEALELIRFMENAGIAISDVQEQIDYFLNNYSLNPRHWEADVDKNSPQVVAFLKHKNISDKNIQPEILHAALGILSAKHSGAEADIRVNSTAHFSLHSKDNNFTPKGAAPATDRFQIKDIIYNIGEFNVSDINQLGEPITLRLETGQNITFTIRGPTDKTNAANYIRNNLHILQESISRSQSLHKKGNLNPEITVLLADKYDYLAGDHRPNNLIIINASDLQEVLTQNENPVYVSELITSLLSEELAHERGALGDTETEERLAQVCSENTKSNLLPQQLKAYINFIEQYGGELETQNGYLSYLKAEYVYSGAKRILVIDDKELWRTFYGEILKNAGYKVIVASSLARALEHIEEVDMVVTDLFLGGLDGIALANEFKDRGFKGPIVVHTASELRHVRKEVLERANMAKERGFIVDLIVKPTRVEDFLRVIDILIEQSLHLSWAYVENLSPENYHPTDLIMSDGRILDNGLIKSIRENEGLKSAEKGSVVNLEGYEFYVHEENGQKILISKDIYDTISDGEVMDVLSKALRETGFERTKDGLPLIITSLSKAPRLFEDCQQNGFIGINQAFLELYRKSRPYNKVYLKILLQVGLEHELAHEKGEVNESTLVNIDSKRIEALCNTNNINIPSSLSFLKDKKIIDEQFEKIVISVLDIITINLLRPKSDDYEAEISNNAMTIFDAIGWSSEWRKGSVVLNLGSGRNSIAWKNFINVDNQHTNVNFGGRFFSGDYLEADFMERLQKDALKAGEHIRGVLLYNSWFYITALYIDERLHGLKDSIREEMAFKTHFDKIWNNIIPEGGDFVFIHFIPPESGTIYESEEITLRIEKFIKDLARNEIDKITHIKDRTSGQIVGIAVRKKIEDAPKILEELESLKNNACGI